MKVRKMARCALCTALLCLCAWLAIPVGDVAVTMQTFGVFLCLGLLGGKWGSITVLLYLLLGAAGLPVFSGIRGGMGALLDASGGYLMGFLALALLYWLLTGIFGTAPRVQMAAMAAGLVLCYVLGTLWYCKIYLSTGGSAALWLIGAKCVLPFILPDGIKLVLAVMLTQRLKKFV